MDDNLFIETLNAAKELKESFKCLSCKNTPLEPYLTGVCDHLLCIDCISKSNICPICDAAFYQKDLQLNKMIKEAILYVNQILDFNLVANEESQDLNSSFPDLDLSVNTNAISNLEKKEKNNSESLTSMIVDLKNKQADKDQAEFVEPLFVAPQPVLTDLGSTQTKSRSRSRSTKSSINNSQKPRSQSTNKIKNSVQNEKENVIGESQRLRTQSATTGKRTRKNDKGETPLHLAVMNEDANTLRELLSDPYVDVNAKDYAGWTPLHEAVNKDNTEIMKILVENSADINALGYQNNTPLHEATLNKRYECVKYLLECGACQTIRNDFGVLAKDFVINCPEFIELFNKNFETSNTNLNILSQSQHQINEDTSISSSYMQRKTKNKVQKKVIIFGTGMKDEDKAIMQSLAIKLNLQVAKEMNNNVTHVIYNTDTTCPRTINYMKAVLMGIWIINLKWLEESAKKGILLAENDYEAKGSVKIPNSNGPFKGRVNASSQYPKLFEDCKFFFYGEFNVFDKQDLVKLVQQAGGSILKREPKLERVDELITTEMPHHLDHEYDKNFCCSHFILYDATKLREDLKHKYLYSVKPSWLFTCIDEFKILHPDSINK